jgi:hypothetical protein
MGNTWLWVLVGGVVILGGYVFFIQPMLNKGMGLLDRAVENPQVRSKAVSEMMKKGYTKSQAESAMNQLNQGTNKWLGQS